MAKPSHSLSLRPRSFGFLIEALVLLLLVAGAMAQVSTTSLRGDVVDPSGAVVRGTQITLANPAAGFSRTATTNDRGEYQFLQVPPGTYTLTAAAAGFTTGRKEKVEVEVDM